MVKQHKRFVQNQVQTHFSQKEKKKYQFGSTVYVRNPERALIKNELYELGTV